jgi:2-hydroxychromene-2-carboxylate isomerase
VRLLDAAWSEGRDITSDSVVHEVADTLSLNGRELLGKTHTTKSSKSYARKLVTA